MIEVLLQVDTEDAMFPDEHRSDEYGTQVEGGIDYQDVDDTAVEEDESEEDVSEKNTPMINILAPSQGLGAIRIFQSYIDFPEPCFFFIRVNFETCFKEQ